ncbi:MAG: cupin domain-containing protein [Dehalococcoidia bacterium]
MITFSKNPSAALVLLAAAWGTAQLAVAQEGANQQKQQASASAVPAQFHRTVILKTALQGLEGKEMLAWVAELAPGANIAMHTHPYDEFVYVVEGSVIMEVEGQAQKTLRAGEIGKVRANTVHGARNASEIFPAKGLVFGLTIEGKPLAVPVK